MPQEKEIKEKIIEDWEKEFEKRFTPTGLECDGDLAGYTSEAIDFIYQLLAQEKQKWEKEKEGIIRLIKTAEIKWMKEEKQKWVEEIEKLAEKSGYGRESYDAFIRISQIDFDDFKQRTKKVGGEINKKSMPIKKYTKTWVNQTIAIILSYLPKRIKPLFLDLIKFLKGL